MKRTLTHVLIVAAGLALTAPAYSAGYLKIGDIKGESQETAQPAPAREIKRSEDAQPAALLLPAVQKARDAAPGKARGSKKGKVEYQWKVEEGSK